MSLSSIISTLATAALPVMLRMVEMLLAATMLAVVAGLLGRTRWLLQRPAIAVGMWMIVMVKAVVPWGPHLTWQYATSVTDVMPNGIIAQINAGPAARPLLWWHVVVPVTIGLWLTVVVWRLVRRLRAGSATWQRAAMLPVADAATQRVVDTLAHAMLAGRRTPDVRVAETATTPFCIGAARPIVVVPTSFVARPSHLRAALAHEFAHLKRHDLAWRAVQLCIVDLLWFFPVAHFASRRIDAAREAACDAIAVVVLNIAPSAYGTMLLDAAAARGTRLVMAISMAGNGQLRSRIAGLALPRKIGTDRVGVALLAGWLGLAAFSVRAQARSSDQPCRYSVELADSLMASHPEADVNADGTLSRDEVCSFEQTLVTAPLALASNLDDRAVQLLASMCCNCQSGGGTPSPSLELSPPVCVQGAP